MFRCTDCLKEYTEHPGFCECGNDNFEEIIEAGYTNQQQSAQYYDDYDEYDDGGAYADDGYDDEYEEVAPPPPPVPKLKKTKSKKSKKKKQITTFDKVGIGVFVVCIILSILSFVFIGSDKLSKSGGGGKGKVLLKKDYTIPNNIDALWDNRLPGGSINAEKLDPSKILNTKLNSIDSELRAYILSLAQEILRNWDRSGISGNGITQIEFKINANGLLEGKKIYKFSGNKSLDSSIATLVGTFKQFQTPPSSYNGEVIIMAFSANNGSTKAYFPNLKAK